jgi:hypothetical protein
LRRVLTSSPKREVTNSSKEGSSAAQVEDRDHRLLKQTA